MSGSRHLVLRTGHTEFTDTRHTATDCFACATKNKLSMKIQICHNRPIHGNCHRPVLYHNHIGTPDHHLTNLAVKAIFTARQLLRTTQSVPYRDTIQSGMVRHRRLGLHQLQYRRRPKRPAHSLYSAVSRVRRSNPVRYNPEGVGC